MTEPKFKAGDVVKLKSGGPSMTVQQFGKWGMIEKEGYKCSWFNDKNQLQDEIFPEATIDIVK